MSEAKDELPAAFHQKLDFPVPFVPPFVGIDAEGKEFLNGAQGQEEVLASSLDHLQQRIHGAPKEDWCRALANKISGTKAIDELLNANGLSEKTSKVKHVEINSLVEKLMK